MSLSIGSHYDFGTTSHNLIGSVQERRNSIANGLELHLSCINPSIWTHDGLVHWRIYASAGLNVLRFHAIFFLLAGPDKNVTEP